MDEASSSGVAHQRDASSSLPTTLLEVDDLDLPPLAKRRKLDHDTKSVKMDSQIWSRLPDDVIERILSWLPIRNLFTFRCVCKKWKNIVSNPSFLQLCSQAPNQGPWFVFFLGDDYNTGSSFDPTSNKWYPLTFPSFPGTPQGPVASHGGLVCFLVEMTDEENRGLFYMCNPLTKDWIELPRILTDFDKVLLELPCMITDFDTIVMGIEVNHNTKAYKVVVAGSNPLPELLGDQEVNIEEADGCIIKAFVYDSSIPWGWKISSTLVIEGQFTSKNVMCSGLLYCVTSRPFGLIAFDVAKEVWIELEVLMPRLLTCCFLIESQGSLMMVGGLGRFGVPTSIHIWRLSPTLQWVKLEKMPRRLFKDFFKSSPSKSFNCIGSGDLLYFNCNKKSQGVLYDCDRHSWHAVPPCPLLATNPLTVVRGFCFTPRLDGAVDGHCIPLEDAGLGLDSIS
ncbi:unnamed protein product [Calypogeia fissa]